MSGHSKWATIKHKKAATDAKKGKEFTKAANMISIAARNGGDPDMNFALRLAIDKARAVNMPKSNIEKAIKRGTGEGGESRIEEIIYEGYGPKGVAVIVETATDNRNRTVSEVRSSFTKGGGNLGENGSVMYQFEERGQIKIDVSKQEISKEELEMVIIESGAEDFEGEELIFVYTATKDLHAVKDSLEKSGVKIESAEIIYQPNSQIEITDVRDAEKIIKFIDNLEELDDVVGVHANFDIPDEIAEKL